MCGAIPPLPQYVFMAWCLVKHRDNFTFFTFLKPSLVTVDNCNSWSVSAFYETEGTQLYSSNLVASCFGVFFTESFVICLTLLLRIQEAPRSNLV
jgi:hypothetical protein